LLQKGKVTGYEPWKLNYAFPFKQNPKKKEEK